MEELRFEEMRNAFMNEVRKIGKKNLEYAQKTGRPFHIGNLHITDGVRALGYSEDTAELDDIFSKYIKCDWGEGWSDAAINDKTIETGYGDVMGIYRLNGHVIWIKTDLNECTRTTILLPEEW